jgi:hypothetical protein
MDCVVMDRAAVSAQIDRILRSQSLANKNQLKKLLEVLFKNFDSQSTLKPDRIIEELWPTETRTKGSADVATEMNRLRRALESYYESEGTHDPVAISLPNRSVATSGGVREERWIAASPRVAVPGRSPALRAKPLRNATAISALTVGVLILAYVSVRLLMKHPRPQFGRLDGTVLRMADGEGKELWSKNFPEGFSTDWYYQKGLAPYLWFGDLEGNGHTSVLFSYVPAGTPASHSSTLICYSDRGKEKWRWVPGRELPELAGSSTTYLTWAVRVLKATATRPPRIVVLSQEQPWWPSQIALLDSKGKTVSEYWHSGGLGYMVLADLDGDGREEIIATGASEYDHQATLLVLDSDRVFGASTEERPEFQIHGMGVAQERLRFLFPRSDLNRALFQFNAAMEPSVENGSLRLTVAECISSTAVCRIFYQFDKNFHLIAAFAGGDEFRSAHERFYQSGKDSHTLSAAEQAAFQKVRCLVGCQSKYVPVGNLVP